MESSAKIFLRLLEKVMRKQVPTRVFLAEEADGMPTDLNSHLHMRLSICLSGMGRYLVLRQGKMDVVELSPGEAVFMLPGCGCLAHPEAAYQSLGIVFREQTTHFVWAKKVRGRPGVKTHRFLHSYQAPRPLSEDGYNFCRAVANTAGQQTAGAYRRHLLQLLMIIARELLTADEPARETGKAYSTWQAACLYLEDHFQQPIGLREVADSLKIHPNHIPRLFRAFGTESFRDRLLRLRLERARALLRDPALNVTEIASLCGFGSANYFIRTFRRRHGHTPARARLLLWHADAGKPFPA